MPVTPFDAALTSLGGQGEVVPVPTATTTSLAVQTMVIENDELFRIVGYADGTCPRDREPVAQVVRCWLVLENALGFNPTGVHAAMCLAKLLRPNEGRDSCPDCC